MSSDIVILAFAHRDWGKLQNLQSGQLVCRPSSTQGQGLPPFWLCCLVF